jgi:hypothetical protein
LRDKRDKMKRLLAKKRPATTKDQWVLKGARQDLLNSKLTSAATRWGTSDFEEEFTTGDNAQARRRHERSFCRW